MIGKPLSTTASPTDEPTTSVPDTTTTAPTSATTEATAAAPASAATTKSTPETMEPAATITKVQSTAASQTQPTFADAGVDETTSAETASPVTATPAHVATDSGSRCCPCCAVDGSEYYGVNTPTWWGQTKKTNTSTTVNLTTSVPVVSQTIAGSRFPERTAQREAFQVSCRLHTMFVR